MDKYVPYIIGGLAAYFLLSGKAARILGIEQPKAGTEKQGVNAQGGGGNWLNPSGQPATSNGPSQVLDTVKTIATTVSDVFNFFKPPSSQSTSGVAATPSGPTASGIPPYLANSSDQSYSDPGFKFWG